MSMQAIFSTLAGLCGGLTGHSFGLLFGLVRMLLGVLGTGTDQGEVNLRQVNQCANGIQSAAVAVHEGPLHQHHFFIRWPPQLFARHGIGGLRHPLRHIGHDLDHQALLPIRLRNGLIDGDHPIEVPETTPFPQSPSGLAQRFAFQALGFGKPFMAVVGDLPSPPTRRPDRRPQSVQIVGPHSGNPSLSLPSGEGFEQRLLKGPVESRSIQCRQPQALRWIRAVNRLGRILVHPPPNQDRLVPSRHQRGTGLPDALIVRQVIGNENQNPAAAHFPARRASRVSWSTHFV